VSAPYELGDGELVPVVAEHHGGDYTAWVLRRDLDADAHEHEWVVTWTDGINHWLEEYDESWHAYARLTALVAACDQDVFLVHAVGHGDVVNVSARDAFVSEAERFVSRTVHASSCAPGCDGTDPVNHGGQVASDHEVWVGYWRMWCRVNETDEHPADEATPERQDDLLSWLLNGRP
jgi:hypothetical protein